MDELLAVLAEVAPRSDGEPSPGYTLMEWRELLTSGGRRTSRDEMRRIMHALKAAGRLGTGEQMRERLDGRRTPVTVYYVK